MTLGMVVCRRRWIDEPGELPGPDGKGDVAQDLLPAEPGAGSAQPQRLGSFLPGPHRCSVETLLVTALPRALISAVIQDW